MARTYEEQQRAELERVPVGARVRVRGCPGLGTGVVVEHITEHRFTDGRVIPFQGHAQALVRLPGDFERAHIDEVLKTSELFVVPSATDRAVAARKGGIR